MNARSNFLKYYCGTLKGQTNHTPPPFSGGSLKIEISNNKKELYLIIIYLGVSFRLCKSPLLVTDLITILL